MITDVKIHFMHENGMGFPEIAEKFGITQFDAAKAWARTESAKDKAALREKIVYRKRLSNVGVKSRHKKLAHYMRTL